MTLGYMVFKAARRLGFDVRRYPKHDFVYHAAREMVLRRTDMVLDIGANEGQYAQAIRRFGYQGPIISFEPVSSAYALLQRASSRDPLWTAKRVALGADVGKVDINIAGNRSASSSVLPMLQSHIEGAASARYVSQETVELSTVDATILRCKLAASRIFMKVDVQGFEHAVLDGAKELLGTGRVDAIQMELSFVNLYEGGPLIKESMDRLYRLGFELLTVGPAFHHEQTGRILQIDGLFVKSVQ